MENDNTQITQLKLLIRAELKDCNHTIWPRVCEMQSTQTGLSRLEDMIVQYVAEEGMPVGSAIALIETELAHII